MRTKVDPHIVQRAVNGRWPSDVHENDGRFPNHSEAARFVLERWGLDGWSGVMSRIVRLRDMSVRQLFRPTTHKEAS